MANKTPTNIVERIEQTLNGQAWANQTFRGKAKLTSFNFPRPSRNFVGNSDTKLTDYVNRTGTDGSSHSRGYAELSWAKSIAVGLHIISGFETPDKNYIKKVFAARKEVENARKLSKSYWNDPTYKAAIEKYDQVWKGKFSAKEQPEAIIKQTHKIQEDLIAEFCDAAVSNQLIDHKSLFRLEPVIKQFVNALNKGANENKLFDSKDAGLHQDTLYNLMLNEEYGADRTAPQMLAQRMLDSHLGEIQSFADTQSHYSKNGKKKPISFNIDISQYSAGGFIVGEGDETLPLQPSMKDRHGKKTDWSVVVKFKEYDNGRVSLSTGLRIVGRQQSNSFIVSKPDFDSWLERLPHSPLGAEASLTTEQAREAHNQAQDALEAARIKGEQENQARREKAIKEQEVRDAKKAAEIKVQVEENYTLPAVTKDSAKGTQLEKKQIIELLDYPELHGLLRHSSLYDVPSVSIQMGLDTENTRGIQHLSNPPYVWGSEEKDNIGNKRFETMNNDMKNCFVQLGDVGPNTTIIIGEGFATVGSLYIAAKRKELDVVCVAAMFVDNLKYALEHYQNEFPNNPMLNAADNDCWNKDDVHSLRSIEDNAGLRMGLILHDSHGLESFSTDWESLGAHNKAQEAGACDFNDMFEVFGYESALENMGNQLEHLIANHKTPAKDMVGPRTFAEAEHGTYDSIFEVYGIDPGLQTSSFITHTGKPLTIQLENDVSVGNDIQAIAKEKRPTKVGQKAPSFEIQKLETGSWVTIDVAETVKEALINHNIEKRYAVESAYSNLINTESDPSRAFNKSLQFVDSSFRCFDVEAEQPFNSVDTYNDINDHLLENDVALFIENENGYVRPIRQDADGELVIGGIKDNVQPRYNSRLALAKAIDAVLTEIEFTENKAFDLATEESFKLRSIDEKNKPLRETDRTFSEEFGLDSAAVLKSAIRTNDIGVKFLDQSEFIEVTCNTTSIDNPKLVTEINKSELGYELENLQANPSVIDIDSGHHQASDLDLNVAIAGKSRALFVLKSYAPNGAQNGQYYLNSDKEVEDKLDSLQFANFVIPTATFKSSNGGLTPISANQSPVQTELMQAQSLDIDQEVDSEQELKKYIASINENSVENNTPSTLASSKTGDRKLIDGVWYDENRAVPVGDLSFEAPSHDNIITEQEMAANLKGAVNSETIPSFSDDLTAGEKEFLNDEIKEFRADEALQETELSDLYTTSLEDTIDQNIDFDEEFDEIEPLTPPLEAERSSMVNEGLSDSALDVELQQQTEEQAPATKSLASSIADEVNSSSFTTDLEDLEGFEHNDELTLSEDEHEALYDDLSFNDVPTNDFMDDDFDMHEFGIDGGLSTDVDGHETLAQTQDIQKLESIENEAQQPLLDESGETTPRKKKTLFNLARKIAKNGIAGVKTLKSSQPKKSKDELPLKPEAVEAAPEVNTEPETVETAPEANAEPEAVETAPEANAEPEAVETAPEANAEPEAVETTPEANAEPEAVETAPEANAEPEAVETAPEANAEPEEDRVSEILDLVLEQINTQPAASYGMFDTKGQWSQADTLLNKSGTQNYVISKLNVSNELPPAQSIRRTTIAAPSSEKLGHLINRAKVKAWDLSKSKSSIFEQLRTIEEQNISPPIAVNDVEPETPQEPVSEKVNLSSPKETEVSNHVGEENTISGNVVKALETLSDMLNSGDLAGEDIANILQKFSQVNPSVDSISGKDVESVTKKQAPKQTKAVSNLSSVQPNESESSLGVDSPQAEQHYNNKGLPVPLSFSAGEPVNSFNEFEFPSAANVEDFVEKAEIEVGDKGNSAIIKKSTFLMSAEVSPDGSVNQLAQNAIDVLCHLKPATDDLTKQEYTAKAGEIANWLNSVAKVGLLIESQRDNGRLPVYSKLDPGIKAKVQESLIRPVNEIKRSCNNDYVDFICIKEAIEKRQIPTATIQQVLYGAYKNIINNRTGLHAKRYINSNTKLNDELKVVLKALIKSGDFKTSKSMKGAYVYTDPVDNSEQTITAPDIMAAASQMMAQRDLDAAIEIPKDVRNMNSVGREKGRVVVGRAIKELTNIDSPIHERREPKTAYTPVGRHAKKEAQQNVPEGMTH